MTLHSVHCQTWTWPIWVLLHCLPQHFQPHLHLKHIPSYSTTWTFTFRRIISPPARPTSQFTGSTTCVSSTESTHYTLTSWNRQILWLTMISGIHFLDQTHKPVCVGNSLFWGAESWQLIWNHSRPSPVWLFNTSPTSSLKKWPSHHSCKFHVLLNIKWNKYICKFTVQVADVMHLFMF